MIYLDHAATTGVRPEVFAAMKPWLEGSYGNPSSAYDFGFSARAAVNRARKQVSALIGASPDEIFFTSGGTESDNWVLQGCARIAGSRKGHIITTAIEHHAILHTADYLEQTGFSITRLMPDENGLISPRSLEAAIRPDTILISIMLANNEIGTIQPIRELAGIAHAHHILFHTDAVQAFGQIPIDVSELGVDFLSASSHKLYGPKGCGCLYIRTGFTLPPLLFGGGQESGMRAGTEAVPSIVGFGAAAELAAAEMAETSAREQSLRDLLISRILSEIPFSRLNGSPVSRLPGNANFSFQFVEGATLLIMLDMKGICVSTGSACTSSSSESSHVLQAIGLPDDLARSSIRITIGRENTEEDIQTAADALKEIIANLRSMSEAYLRMVKKH